MNLADLIDMEAQIAADEKVDPGVLRDRDQGVVSRISPLPDDRRELLSCWVRGLRAVGEPSLGEHVVLGMRMLKLLLLLFGLLTGWSTARLLLYYDGSDPINVATYLLVIVAVQLLLVALLFVVVPLLRKYPNLPIVSDLYAMFRWLAAGLEKVVDKVDRRLSPERRELWRAGRHRLRTRASLYPGVEQWLLLDVAQVFAVAFNVAVLACALKLVFFTDLAFSWSTTVKADGASFHRITSTLSAPFGWLVPDAVPSPDLVEATRYWRGEFHDGLNAVKRAFDVKRSEEWWAFLIAVTVTYGLLPRILILLFARYMRRRSLLRLPLDTPDVDRIVRRLRGPAIETRSREVVPFQPDEAAPSPKLVDVGGGVATAVVLWKDLPADAAAVGELTRVALGSDVAAMHHAGGVDYEHDVALAKRLAAGAERILVLAEGFEAPDKSVRTFLADLRQAVGTTRTLLVGLVQTEGAKLVPADAEDVELWTNRLRLLNDPYLAVETMEPS